MDGPPGLRRQMRIAAGLDVVIFASLPCQQSAAQSGALREVPARTLPVPDTVSPQMQAMIARPLNPNFNIAPGTTAEWKKRVDDAAAATVAGLPRGAHDQASWDASTPDPTLMSMSLVSRSSSPPTTVVMTATRIGYHSPL